MIVLNLPEYSFKLKRKDSKVYIFDIIRKKYYLLTPEEWVRQHLIQYLVTEKKYPRGLIVVEQPLHINNMTKRADLVVYNHNQDILLLAECKAPHVPITQSTFDQIARYNQPLNASFLVLSNGMQHYVCQIDHLKKTYHFLEEIPTFTAVYGTKPIIRRSLS